MSQLPSPRGWGLDYATDGADCPPSAQHVGVYDAAAAGQAEADSVIILSPG